MRLTSRVVAGLAGLLLVAGAGCASQNRTARAPTVASAPAKDSAQAKKVAENQEQAKQWKGIGATGGPAGRDDLRPNLDVPQ